MNMHLICFLLLIFSSCKKENDAQLVDQEYLYPIRDHRGWGYINKDGKEVIVPKYISAGFFIGSRALVSNRLHTMLIDLKGKEILKFKNEHLLLPLDLNEKALKVEQPDSIQLFNLDGEKVFVQSRKKFHYLSSTINCNRILTSSMGDRFQYLDSKGKVRLEFNRGSPNDFDEETALAAIFFKNKTCFIDTLGKTRFCVKDMGQNGFSSGLALIENGTKKYFIDSYGKKILEVSHYENVSSFINGIAKVSKGGKSGLIDKTGRAVIPLIYSGVEYFSCGAVVVKPTKARKYYFVDQNNQRIMDQSFDYVEFPGFVRDLAWVVDGNKKGWINKKGEFVWIEEVRK